MIRNRNAMLRTDARCGMTATPCWIFRRFWFRSEVLLNDDAVIGGRRYDADSMVTVWNWRLTLCANDNAARVA